MTDENHRFLVAFFGLVALIFYLGHCTPAYGSRTRFDYKRPLVVWGYWTGAYYTTKRWWIPTVYIIK